MRAPVVVRCADGRVTLQADQADALRRSGELQGRTRPRTWLTRGEVEALLIRRPEFSVSRCGHSMLAALAICRAPSPLWSSGALTA